MGDIIGGDNKFAKGGIIKGGDNFIVTASPGYYFNPVGYYESPSTLGYETLSLTIAAAAIALGLDKAQTAKFGDRAYTETRGKTIDNKYEALIRLAFEIKEADGG